MGNVDGVDIDWATARAANLENWDDRVPLHEEAYNLAAFRDPTHLSDVVVHDLASLAPHLPGGTVQGLDVCHLQCHIGTDTLSLARAGARVTGVDFSAPALDAARRLAATHGMAATWVEADVLEARAAVEGEFDLVYTSIGTVSWLPDLQRWARQIAALLRPGGTFYFRDAHPALYALDEEADHLSIRYRYFGDGRAQQWDDASTYAGSGSVEHVRTFEWPHPVSEIVNALLAAGLSLVRLDEGRSLPWRFSERMVEAPGGYAWPGPEKDLVPCTLTVVARRP